MCSYSRDIHQMLMDSVLSESQEYLVTHEKIPTIIANLITTEVWKEKVFPHILKKVSLEASFQLYMMVSKRRWVRDSA